MFVWDPTRELFVFGENADSQPELWHGVLPGRDVGMLQQFFGKLRTYDADPTSYAEPKIWYDDFPYLKESFNVQKYDQYINTFLFADGLYKVMTGGELRFNHNHATTILMDVLQRAYGESIVEEIEETQEFVDTEASKPLPPEHQDPWFEEDRENAFAGLGDLMANLEPDEVAAEMKSASETPTPTLLVQKSLEGSFASLDKVFGDSVLADMRQNLAA